jgi:Tfp pilus assembly protein PilF
LKLDPQKANAYGLRAMYKVEQGKIDEALVDCNKAIEIDPNNAVAYDVRALAYFKNNEFDKSWVDEHKAESLGIKMDPEFLNDLKDKSHRDK